MTTQVAETRDAPDDLRCTNCRITLRSERVTVGGRDYCCDGCSNGGPCCC